MITKLILLLTLCLPVFVLSKNDSEGDSTTVKKIMRLANEHLKNGKMDSADFYYNKAGVLAKKINYHQGFFDYTSRYSNFLFQELRYKEALIIGQQQLELSLKLNEKKRASNAYNNIALQYHALGNFHLSAENFIKGLRLSEQLNDSLNQRITYTNMASLFFDIGDKKKSLYYSQKGYDLAIKLKDEVQIARSLVNLGCSKTLNGNYKEAIADFKQVIAFGKNTGDITMELIGIINIADIYIRTKDYTKALEWNQKGYAMLNPNTHGDYDIYILGGLANSYFNLKQYKKADHFFKQVIGNAEDQLTKNELRDLYLIGSNLKEQLGKPAEALMLRKKYQTLSDSMLNANTQNSIQEQEIKYQSSLKEKTLAQQKLKLSNHRYELQKKNKWLIFSISLCALFMTLSLLIYLVYRQRQKASLAEREKQLLQARLTGEEKERSRQARELHDGVGGILSAARMQMSTLKDEIVGSQIGTYAQTLSLINYASEEVRNISHNLAPEVVLNEGLEMAITRFCKRISQPGLSINCYLIGKIPALKSEYELLIYRIVQEAVNNILKHAKATEAIVQLSINDTILSLTIEDNGIGFDTAIFSKTGMGLMNLQSRTMNLGGTFEISSLPNSGTTIFLEFDVKLFILNPDHEAINLKAKSFSTPIKPEAF